MKNVPMKGAISVREVTVILVETRYGQGTGEDPVRVIQELFAHDGRLLVRFDTHTREVTASLTLDPAVTNFNMNPEGGPE